MHKSWWDFVGMLWIINNKLINTCLIVKHVYKLTVIELFVCRGRISSGGQIKLSIFGTVYTVCFAILFFYEVAVSGILIIY